MARLGPFLSIIYNAVVQYRRNYVSRFAEQSDWLDSNGRVMRRANENSTENECEEITVVPVRMRNSIPVSAYPWYSFYGCQVCPSQRQVHAYRKLTIFGEGAVRSLRKTASGHPKHCRPCSSLTPLLVMTVTSRSSRSRYVAVDRFS